MCESVVKVLLNIDDLFEREELSAAPDVGWPDCFNSGVFVFRPSNDTYSSLLQFALTTGSFDGKFDVTLQMQKNLYNVAVFTLHYTVASLRSVLPGAVTDGVTLFTSKK